MARPSKKTADQKLLGFGVADAIVVCRSSRSRAIPHASYRHAQKRTGPHARSLLTEPAIRFGRTP